VTHASVSSVSSTSADAAALGPVVDADTPARAAAQRLRNTLRLNAATSMIGGLVAAIAGGPVDRLLGTDRPDLVRLMGGGLVGFALGVLVVAGARIRRLTRWSAAVIVADVVWVIASAATIIAGAYSLSGDIAVIALATMVAVFAVRQTTTRARILRHGLGPLVSVDESPPVEVVHYSRAVSGDIDVAWSVITDHDLYGRLAPNLSAVRATSENGTALARTCTNRSGGEWHETCTLWESGHRYEIAVDTTAYPYPLAVMRGSWSVQPATHGEIRLAMDFRFQPRPDMRGRLFAAAMHAGFPVVLRRIVRGWEREITRRTASGKFSG
jgi:ribosome-associated toxin RatA of RatAB toxin-antitoxin module